MAGLICLVALAISTPYIWQHPVLNVHELMARQQESHLLQYTPAAQELQELPARVPLNMDMLRDFCGTVQGIVDSLPDVEGEAIAAPTSNVEPSADQANLTNLSEPSPPLFKRTYNPPLIVEPLAPIVRVENESDRLAMLMPRRPKGEHLSEVLIQTASVPAREKPVPVSEQSNTEAEKSESQKAEPNKSPSVEVKAEPTCPLIRPRPEQLIERLKALSAASTTAEWSTQVLEYILPLTDEIGTTVDEAREKLAQLRTLTTEGKDGSRDVRDPGLQQLWLQAAEGLERRLGIWELLLADEPPTVDAHEYEASGTLMPLLGDIASLLAGTSNGEAWRDYLLLDQIALATSEGVGVDRHARLTLAQEVLSRLADSRLTEQQQEFIAREPLASLGRELRPWATGPVELNTLLALLERYEAQGGHRYAAAIAQLEQRMRWSNNQQLQSLAEEMHEQYRGTNMRIAISKELMNRMIPEQHIRTAPVRESIAGKRVKGRSRTSTDVEVELLPNEDAWQFELQADGRVYSRTRSETWPVRVHNAARYEYEADKVITIAPEGLKVARAKSTARGRNEFLGADSQFDRVPILGAMFRDLGKNQNQKNRHQAMSQVKAKVAYQARSRMDKEADPKLTELEQRFQDRVLAPFGNLALAAETVDMHTTAKRAVMQLRLANLDQLAAHTPRPSAPADSVLSMQLHETALNNALAGLELEGRRMTLHEVHALLAEKMGYENAQPPEDLPARAIVEFAPYDAVHVSFAEDRLELVMNIRELAHGRDKIPNFEVHTFHRPVVDGLTVKLVQDETLQFAGRNLRTGHRVVLHSVMGKLFSRADEIAVLKRLQSDKRLTGLMVTQLVIDDGWLGLALGPAAAQRTAWRTPTYQVEEESVR
ncbi:hypothetical protein [Bythopirellula goksoeyrii]|nr:hypothetical protein [Bythopirellula goksoeyrii]